MLISFARALIIYTVILVVMRIMGKRQIGQLQPFELVVAIMIADIGAIPMENEAIPLLSGLVPIFALFIAELFLSYITLKNERLRRIVCGSPSIVIENGKINIRELKRLRYNLNDLLEQLRSKDIFSISDVEYAIMETGGQLNVIPKSQKRPVTPEDLNISTDYEGIPVTLIMDGQIHHNNLKLAKKDLSWLSKELEKRGLESKKVFFASLDTKGNLEVQAKE